MGQCYTEGQRLRSSSVLAGQLHEQDAASRKILDAAPRDAGTAWELYSGLRCAVGWNLAGALPQPGVHRKGRC
jgi:hypothetical protein